MNVPGYMNVHTCTRVHVYHIHTWHVCDIHTWNIVPTWMYVWYPVLNCNRTQDVLYIFWFFSSNKLCTYMYVMYIMYVWKKMYTHVQIFINLLATVYPVRVWRTSWINLNPDPCCYPSFARSGQYNDLWSRNSTNFCLIWGLVPGL